MKRLNVSCAITLITVCGILVNGVAYAKDRTSRYEVTITNITGEQIISPPIVMSHNNKFQLFTLGNPATPGLAELAEEGMTGPLAAYLDTLDSVYSHSTAGGAIMPGASVMVEIETKWGFRLISAAGMAVSSNDAFFAIRGVYARSWADAVVKALAYDAGSEANNEECAYIPGPPCDPPNMRATDGAEGYVYIHSGIHGIGDLDPAQADWNNPVAIIKIKKVK